MAVVSGSYDGWNHDFPRLARDAGFTFDTRRNKTIVNWNDIKVIDVERIVRERDFTTIDQQLTQVLDCQLEKEFDVRILDAGFVKLFRLAQLSVEYLVQCRRLLDTSVASLRRQGKEMTEEVDYLKKLLRNKEEEIRKLRNRSKKHQQSHRTSDYVKTSDISNLFKKMVNEGQSARSGMDEQLMETFQKCQRCDKVFLNQFYLHSHIVRRHPNRHLDKNNEPESPGVSPVHESKYKAETERLLQEIKDLKDRVNATERRLNTNETLVDNDLVKLATIKNDTDVKEDKVEKDSMEKETIAKMMFESWKTEEELKFKKQIDELKKQLDESDKRKEEFERHKFKNDGDELAKLTDALQRQEAEMRILRDQLQTKASHDSEEFKHKLEEQEKMWQNKLKEAESEHNKRMEDLNKNMFSLMSDARQLQQQYTTKIEVLEKEAGLQKKMLEEQTRKLNRVVEQETKAVYSKSPERRRHNNFEELKKSGVGESTETLPPYDEGSLENIPRLNSNQNTNKIIIKNMSTTDESVQSANLESPKTNAAKENADAKPQQTANGQNRPKSAKKSLSAGASMRKRIAKVIGNTDNDYILLSPVKNVEDAKNLKEEEEESDSEDSDEFATGTVRSKTPTLYRHDSSNGGSQRERVMVALRADLVEILNKRLQQMGIAKNNKGMSKDTYDKNMVTVKHREQLFSKKYDNYLRLKKRIATALHDKAKELKSNRSPTPYQEIRKSNSSLNKVGSILSNVKSKAMSKIKDMKKSANESFNIKAKTSFNKEQRSPVKNAGLKISTTSIMSVAKDLDELESESLESDDALQPAEHKRIVTSAMTHNPSTSVENLLNSPIRKPTNVDEMSLTSSTPTKTPDSKVSHFGDLSDVDDRKDAAKVVTKSEENIPRMYAGATSSSDDSSAYDDKLDIRKSLSVDNVSSARTHSQKGVLKSSVSTSALAKKRVLFDLDANQIKSRSTSPSVSAAIEVRAKDSWDQRANEDTDDTDSDWNISSQAVKNSSEDLTLQGLPLEDIKLSTKQSPKIAEISKTIGLQLGVRSVKPPVGSIDTLFKQTDNVSPKRVNVYGGNATSAGSFTSKGNNALVATTSKSPRQLPTPLPRNLQRASKSQLESDLELSDWSLDDFVK